MATITYSSAADQLYFFTQSSTITVRSATSMTFENAYGRITLTGTGFTFDSVTGAPNGGTATSAKLFQFDNSGSATPTLMATFSGLSYTFTTYSSYYLTDLSFLLSGADTITGSSGDDRLLGGIGNDTITGGAGNDTIDGGSGNDTMSGGGGNDIYYVDSALDVVTEAAGAGIDKVIINADVVTSGLVYTLGDNIENIDILKTTTNYYYTTYQITGNALNNLMMSAANTYVNFSGGAGADRLFGGNYNDTLDGGAGVDTMMGGGGGDTYIVDNVGDKVIESTNESGGYDNQPYTATYADYYNYSYGNSYLSRDMVKSSVSYTLGINVEDLTLTGTGNINGTGNALNNMIIANSGNNVLNGGAGIDTLSYETATAKITASLALTTAQATGGSGSDTIKNIENLIGGSAGDALTGNAGNNLLSGRLGDDTLTGGAGNDVLIGGMGNDRMVGGTGNDTFYVDSTSDVVVEKLNEGIDTVMITGSGVTSYTLSTYLENLDLTNASTNMTGTGNAAANNMKGSYYNDTLYGGDGNDTLYGGDGGNDALYGGAGNDTLNVYNYTNATCILNGGTGADVMTGSSYGSNTFYVDNVGDIVRFDNYYYYAYYNPVNTVVSSISYTLGDHLNNLTLTGTAALRGGGNELDNVIIANAGNNYLDGGAGNDTASYATATTAVKVSLALSGAQATGGSGSDTLINFENLTGGAGNDTLTGNAQDNILFGGAGNDTLSGGAGNDTLDGGAGADTMNGGAGNDTYVVNLATDKVTEALNAGYDTVQSSVNYTLGANVEALILTGTSSINGTGNSLDNYLVGNEYTNTLAGNDGNDTLDGGYGNDIMIGGNGNDTYHVDSISDVVTESSAGGIDTVIASIYGNVDYTLADNVENLILSRESYSYYTYSVSGNALNNTITGSTLAETMNGGAGNDTLYGNGGNDTLSGGTGSDTFVLDGSMKTNNLYYAPTYSTYTITDFVSGTDKIQLDDNYFTALNVPGTLTATSLDVGADSIAANAATRLIFDTTTHTLYYDADGSGSEFGALQLAVLTGVNTLAASDFVVA